MGIRVGIARGGDGCEGSLTEENGMRTIVRLAVILFVVVTSVAFGAQDMQQKYTVQKGDNLWNLSGDRLRDPLMWQQVVKDNPFLAQPGRKFEQDGKTVVVIRPGEKLVGLEKFGITPALPAPIDALPVVDLKGSETGNSSLPWSIWAILAIIAALTAWWLLERMLNKSAATAGTPVVPGGVTEQTARTQFQEMAALRHQRATGTSLPTQQFIVVDQVAGRISGVMNVRYADGREVPRRLKGERAFRANVRFPNGTVETLYMLQACGNDLRYGGISRYLPGPEFRFEPDAQQATASVVPAPAATAAPAPALAIVPAAAQEPAAATQQDEATFRFEFKPANDTEPGLVRVKGAKPNFNVSMAKDGTVTLRYQPIEAYRK